ncbi:MAG TPA: pitrilysin family protein [Thermoanaerobaculia bacterium]|jgi:predicted Zn-dependent peptidase
MPRPWLLFLAVLLCPSPASADVQLVSRQLPNGLRVVLASKVRSEKIAIHLAFDAGSRRDGARTAGVAWLASRIMAGRLTRLSIGLNQERAYATAEVAAQDLPAEMAGIATALANPTLTRDDFERTRDSLLREAREKAGKPYSAASAALLRSAYGRTARGHEPEVAPARVSPRDVEKYLRRHYGMASTVLVLAGTLDEASVMARIEAAFSTLPAGPPRQPCSGARAVNARGERQSIIRDPKVPEGEISIAYITPDSTHPDWLAMNILADIIGQGPGSRLQQALAAAGLVTSFVEGMTESPCGPSLLRMRARIKPGVSISAVQRALDGELLRLTQQLVSPEEITIAREQERQWAATQLEPASGVANALARVTLFYRDPERINTELAAMVAVTREDVLRVAQRYLKKSNRVVVVTDNTQERISAAGALSMTADRTGGSAECSYFTNG